MTHTPIDKDLEAAVKTDGEKHNAKKADLQKDYLMQQRLIELHGEDTE